MVSYSNFLTFNVQVRDLHFQLLPGFPSDDKYSTFFNRWSELWVARSKSFLELHPLVIQSIMLISNLGLCNYVRLLASLTHNADQRNLFKSAKCGLVNLPRNRCRDSPTGRGLRLRRRWLAIRDGPLANQIRARLQKSTHLASAHVGRGWTVERLTVPAQDSIIKHDQLRWLAFESWRPLIDQVSTDRAK
jgi:hypothetical protein